MEQVPAQVVSMEEKTSIKFESFKVDIVIFPPPPVSLHKYNIWIRSGILIWFIVILAL